ncbi:hypothetical protein [Ideonella sp.]|uniref:hypothetical protein n=1 Tax=Ideonella sp. TaxID=1929293 RepID=UPI0035B36514
MNRDATLSWVLGVVAVAVGYVQWGWQGVVLATTLVVFWLLLQFSRALRTMRDAAAAPIGSVASAVMLHSKLRPGMRLPQVLRLTASLGRPVSTEPEAFEWGDASGAKVRTEWLDGRLVRWDLVRPAETAEPSSAQVPPA